MFSWIAGERPEGLQCCSIHFQTRLANWMNFRSDFFLSSSGLALRFPSLPSAPALSATRQKTSTAVLRVRYRDGDSQSVSGRNSQSLSLSLCCLPGTPPRLSLCPVSSTARQGICIHPALCSAPSLAVRRCPHNLLPTPNWIASLVFCAGLAPAVFHLLS